ncbi:tellurite resistance protein TerC [Parafrankia irregularis]|uniref:Tellurite resistance protein TerC n=1 Tax=Parafrankia irregularis TaxID=795642 RepID=A0A0S4QKP4_9ACTN|nr:MULTISPECIES: TerC family protein [Parafrankia]MBE3202081.1 TerC family protein [Parafrankia sp. CH37]CUU55860.1 tellurite resistance protein TerC [Parafrankia irregularis]
MHVPVWAWAAFVGGLLLLLAIDLLAHRKAHVIGFREAAWWSVGWVSLGITFAFVIWAWQGPGAAGEYTAAYLLEKSLSVDNLFVFALIFSYFKVPREYQHRVLFYGVLGALVLRFVFIAAGITLLEHFSFVIYIFGAFLLFTAFKMVRDDGVDMDPGQSRAVKLLRKVMPVTDSYEGQHFVLRRAGKLVATPLLAVLVAIETADVLFAFDSVPAALGVTNETFLVYTANALAILGLRSLFFLLSGLMEKFHHLATGLAVILAFIGVKMLLTDVWHMPIWLSLTVIAVVLAGSITWSLATAPPSDADGDAADGGAVGAGAVGADAGAGVAAGSGPAAVTSSDAADSASDGLSKRAASQVGEQAR